MKSEVIDLTVSAMTVPQEPKEFSTLIDSIPSLVASVDCNMAMRFCNKHFKNWFSIPDGNVTGKSFPAIVGNQVFGQLQRHMGKVLVGNCAHFEIYVNTISGIQYLDVTLSPEFDGLKRVTGFVFHSSDITEKNRTERALKDYFESASIGLHWVNAEGIIIWANPAELNLLGYSEDEYIGHHISEFHAHQDVIQDILRQLASKNVLKNYEADLVCKDGSIKNVAINSTVLWEGDKFIHTRCFTIDITEQKLAAKALKESEERFRMMANLVPLVIWTTDQNGQCNFLSVKWKEVTGKNVEDGYGNQWLAFIHPDDFENIQNSWRRSFAARKLFEAKFRYLTSSGSFKIHYVHATPRIDLTGQFVGYIGILQDISSEEQIRYSLEKIVMDRTEDLRKRNAALKSAEKALLAKNDELEKINSELTSFAHIASHDLQEPLRKIQIFASRLLNMERSNLSEKGAEFLSRIHTSTDRMRALIHDLLAYSKTSNFEGSFELTDLNEVFNEVVGELEVKIEEKNARIENAGLPAANVLKFQFHQLFLNLLSNSLKFAKPDCDLRVVVKSELVTGDKIPGYLRSSEKTYYCISIADNGIGFEPEYSEKIFEIFHRLHARIQYEGTGIGLSICKRIVENHGGIIEAEGAVNQGATFRIYIPA